MLNTKMNPTANDKLALNRMAQVIRNAISDEQIMRCLTPKDLIAILPDAVEKLSPSDVRGFIYRCMTSREIGKGLIMADRAVDFALDLAKSGNRDACSEIVGAAVGTLSILSESTSSVKHKIDELLAHDNPAIVVPVIENLGRTSDMKNFNRVSDLLLSDDADIALSAAKYVEACARDAAFRKRKSLHVIEDAAEEFLRNALLKLEGIHGRLKDKNADGNDILRRLVILVAMMYNEILDSMDWRRSREEAVDDRIYYALEEHLFKTIGPDARPFLFRILTHPEVEDGIKRSALLTLGRLTKQADMATKITLWLPDYIALETSDDLALIAQSILTACHKGKRFSVLSYLPEAPDKVSMIPRTAGAPPKLRPSAAPTVGTLPPSKKESGT